MVLWIVEMRIFPLSHYQEDQFFTMYIFQQKKEDIVIGGGSERSEPLVVLNYLQRERHFVPPKYGQLIWW